MKSIVPIHRFTSRLRRTAAASAIHLTTVLLAWAAFSGPAAASITPDAKPKVWPANPAQHQVVIRREATDDKQSAMIAAAEAAQPSKEALRKAAGEDPAPAGNKVWWYQEQLGLRIPCAITGDAVSYYSEVIGKYGQQAFNRFVQPSSRLDYHAVVKFHKEFKQGDQTYQNVHVVTLKLTFSQNFAATMTEGMHFEKERIVVLDANGKALHISGDGPTEVPVLAI